MEILNRKLSLLKGKVENSQPITIMIIGLGSVGCYLLDYLVSLGDSQLRLVVVGRNAEKMQMDINITLRLLKMPSKKLFITQMLLKIVRTKSK